MQNKGKKLCLIVHCLAFGGLAKAAANLSIALDKMGYDVFIVTVYKDVSFEYAGTLINMGLYKSDGNWFINRVKRLLILKKELNKIEVDVFIDLRTRTSLLKEILINKFFYTKNNVVYTIHSGSYEKYIMNSIRGFKYVSNRSLGLVCVSQGLSSYFKEQDFKNVTSINNPIDIDEFLSPPDLEIIKYKYVLSAGQMNTNVKGYYELILAYKKSNLFSKNIKLIILGSGKLMFEYKKLVEDLALSDFVIFKGYQSSPYTYFKQAEFFVLSSKNEGFPTVLLESLACGVPVIAYDCFTGPSEIIKHKVNGLLVDDQNIDELSKAMRLFVENNELRDHCSSNAKKSLNGFSFKQIGEEWECYLKKVMK